jgi:hypothetical protein
LKHFCWRMLCNCLPTRLNLHRRGVPCQLDCVLCSSEVEDKMHLFLDCDQAVQCWKEANSWHKLEHHQRQSGSFSTIIFSILTSLDEVSCAHFVAALRSIWREQMSTFGITIRSFQLPFVDLQWTWSKTIISVVTRLVQRIHPSLWMFGKNRKSVG